MHKKTPQKIVYISKNSFEPVNNPKQAYKLTYYHDVLYNIESSSGLSFSAKMRPTKNKKLEIIRYAITSNVNLCYYFNTDGTIRTSFFEKSLYHYDTESKSPAVLVGEYNRYSMNSTLEKFAVDNRAFWNAGVEYTNEIKRITGFESKEIYEFNSHKFDQSERFQLNVTFNDFYVSEDYSQKIYEITDVIKKIQSNY